MNLAKRKHVEDKTCLFCSEQETVGHLFFGCCVAKVLWAYLTNIFHVTLGVNYESVARWWVSNKKYKIMNSFLTALMWCLLKFRNEMCFQGKMWMGEKLLLRNMFNMLKSWRILFADIWRLGRLGPSSVKPVLQVGTTARPPLFKPELTYRDIAWEHVKFGSVARESVLHQCSSGGR
jgi:hypothetical protein